VTTLYTIDCEYQFKDYAASYLLIEEGKATFIENNTAFCVPKLLRTLREAGLDGADVEYVIVTHVHLDHAGGTSALMARCPNAICLAHPRAARHLIDPSRLVAGARQVYGEKRFSELYGEISGIPAARVRAMQDEEKLEWGKREFTFLHTRGHANHHFCVHDSKLEGTFTGDAFGIRYPVLQTSGLFVFPSTSPTEFHAGEAQKSIHRIAVRSKRVFPTHFGQCNDVEGMKNQLLDWIEFSALLQDRASRSGLEPAPMLALCQQAVDGRFREALSEKGLLNASNWELTRLDRELNAAGIQHAAASSIPNA
jgi:glyoxylase-like metal-dependent hydrolase (beta-lactamase superfamily II)